MGLLDVLKGIGKGALHFITGGASDLIPGFGSGNGNNDSNGNDGNGNPLGSILNAAGQWASGTSAGRAQGRVDAAGVNQNQDRNAINLATLQQRAPGVAASNSVRGDILSNAHDFSYGAPTMVGNIPMPSSSGGLRPSIFSPATRALGSNMFSQALDSSTHGYGLPSLTPLPQAGATDSILNTAATIGQLGSLGSQIPRTVPKPKPTVPGMPPDYTGPNNPYNWSGG